MLIQLLELLELPQELGEQVNALKDRLEQGAKEEHYAGALAGLVAKVRGGRPWRDCRSHYSALARLLAVTLRRTDCVLMPEPATSNTLKRDMVLFSSDRCFSAL